MKIKLKFNFTKIIFTKHSDAIFHNKGHSPYVANVYKLN